MNNTPHISTSNMNSVRGFDPEFNGSTNEYVFAWDQNKPMIRPSAMICPSCNSQLAVSSDPLDIPNCKNRQCKNCGSAAKMYGQNNRDLVYDAFNDDTDYEDSMPYDMEYERPDYDMELARDQALDRKLAAEREYELERNYGYYYDDDNYESEYDYDNANNNFAESGSDRFEHLTNDNNMMTSGICSYVCCAILMLIIAYFIAFKRGEIYNEDGKTVNLSLIACIFFFCQFYFAYALTDWLTRPNHGNVLNVKQTPIVVERQ